MHLSQHNLSVVSIIFLFVFPSTFGSSFSLSHFCLIMVLEIIDLTNSPPSSPSKSLNESVTLTSNKRIQFEHAPLPIMADTNPNLSQTNQQQTTLCPIPRQTYGPSQIVNRFPSVMQGGDVTILDPITGSNTNLVSHGARLKEPCLYESWTQGEHEFVSFNLNLINFILSFFVFSYSL